jgi:hypothetical protein
MRRVCIGVNLDQKGKGVLTAPHSSAPLLSSSTSPDWNIVSFNRCPSAVGNATRIRIFARCIGSLELVWMSLMHSVTCRVTISSNNIRWTRTTSLALCGLARLDAKARLGHCLFYHSDGDWLLCFRVNTLLGYKCGDFLPELGEFVVSFCFTNLDLPFVQDLYNAFIVDTIVRIHLTKCLPQVIMLGNLALGDVREDVVYLKDVI